jgi:hypothetical protein
MCKYGPFQAAKASDVTRAKILQLAKNNFLSRSAEAR